MKKGSSQLLNPTSYNPLHACVTHQLGHYSFVGLTIDANITRDLPSTSVTNARGSNSKVTTLVKLILGSECAVIAAFLNGSVEPFNQGFPLLSSSTGRNTTENTYSMIQGVNEDDARLTISFQQLQPFVVDENRELASRE